VLDHPLAFVVLALAEVVVPDPALRIREVDGRPVPVREGAPHPVVAVECDRVIHSHGLHGLADVVNLTLERELRRVDTDDDEPQVTVFAAHARTKASVRSQLMQVYVQKSTRTTLPRSPAGVRGKEFNQPVAPSKPGR
jgi:hypothetical protein